MFDTELGRRLHNWGIDLNGADNGVWLPRVDYEGRIASLHSGNHLQSYYDEVDELLSSAADRNSALSIINSIRNQLLSGDLPLQAVDT